MRKSKSSTFYRFFVHMPVVLFDIYRNMTVYIGNKFRKPPDGNIVVCNCVVKKGKTFVSRSSTMALIVSIQSPSLDRARCLTGTISKHNQVFRTKCITPPMCFHLKYASTCVARSGSWTLIKINAESIGRRSFDRCLIFPSCLLLAGPSRNTLFSL